MKSIEYLYKSYFYATVEITFFEREIAMKDVHETVNTTVAVELSLWERFKAIRKKSSLDNADLINIARLECWDKVCSFLDNDNLRKCEPYFSRNQRRYPVILYKDDLEAIKKLAKIKKVTQGFVFAIIIFYIPELSLMKSEEWHKKDFHSVMHRLKIAKEYYSSLVEWKKNMPNMPEELQSFPELSECFDGNDFGIGEAEVVLDNAIAKWANALEKMETKADLLKRGMS